MGVAIAGIAFRSKEVGQPIDELVSALFKRPCREIAQPNQREFDIRHPSDVMVEFFNDVCFVYSNELVWDILDNPEGDTSHIFATLNRPELIVGFCNYDSGGSYGYVFIENGVRTRSRLETVAIPGRAPIREYGSPKEFEARWLSAPSYFEEDEGSPPEDHVRIYHLEAENLQVAEFSLTSRMLYEALVNSFGVCPWDTNTRSNPRFFKLETKLVVDVPSILNQRASDVEQSAAISDASIAAPKKGGIRSRIASILGLAR
ncbi:hypothetical protein NDK50_10125 [Paraburkholderia bryophila]|uniref:hypothetical protein n=1 Tax=Paraburkholderia bryophila TaxID=420952 RepID=UPI002349F5D3|nr:hypothetical protein [Paraburkholderia bryophila]WCM21775.1 hypothetical protein NDK50_10125 [Paraburkholderia bryophila]